MDRGYVDFGRLFELSQCLAFFVTRAKSNLQFRRLYSHSVDKTTGLRCDQTIVLTGFYSRKDYPAKLRRIKYRDAETGMVFVFLTNNFSLPALTIAKLYRHRWKVELLFNLDASLYTILQILSVTLLEGILLKQALTDQDTKPEDCNMRKQLNLFGKLRDSSETTRSFRKIENRKRDCSDSFFVSGFGLMSSHVSSNEQADVRCWFAIRTRPRQEELARAQLQQ